MNLSLWSPTTGDVTLTAALLGAISGDAGGSQIQTAITTAGAGTLTAAALLGGIIARTGPSAAYTDTTDTAAAIVTALGGFNSGQTFVFQLKNATIYPQTLAAGTGVTASAITLVPPLSVATYFGTIGGTTVSPTVTTTHVVTAPLHAPQAQTNPQATALNTVGAGTIPAAGIASGYTARGGAQIAAFTDTTDTAAAIIANSALAATVGASIEWTYVNNTIFPATLAGGATVTPSGSLVVPANSWAKYLLTATSSTAVSMVCVGQGFFPHSGTFVANGATPVTVADVNLTANSSVTITLKTVGGTVSTAPVMHIATVTPGTGFTVVGSASDTSTYTYEIRG